MKQHHSHRIGVLMGGWGEERDRSLVTGEAVATALESRGHDVVRVLAGPLLDQTLRDAALDVAFIALHGRMGEDGNVQGLLEVLGIPYTGAGTLGSALAMNKTVAKKLFRAHNLATPTGYTVTTKDLERLEALHLDLGFPCVVKPSNGGSSVGLTVVTTRDQLRPAVEKACQFGGAALVERHIKGREVTVGVLGERVLGSTLARKPEGTAAGHPALSRGALSATRLRNLESMALAATRALGVTGYATVDFICSDTANDVVLEVNTLPLMTKTSLLPQIAAAAGLSFEDLCEAIVESATLESAFMAQFARAPARSEPALEAATG